MTRRKPGPAPLPELRRSVRVSVSLPADVGEMLAWLPGHKAKSETVEDALRLWFWMSENERDARLAAALFNQRGTTAQ